MSPPRSPIQGLSDQLNVDRKLKIASGMSTVLIGRSGHGEVYERTNWSPSHQLVSPASHCVECAATHAITTCCWSGVRDSCSPTPSPTLAQVTCAGVVPFGASMPLESLVLL